MDGEWMDGEWMDGEWMDGEQRDGVEEKEKGSYCITNFPERVLHPFIELKSS